MKPQLELEEANIVIRGQFNPIIFHPSWFSAQNLIPQQEADKATIQIIHADISSFETQWMQLQVVRDRFLVKTNQEPYYEALRDLVLGTFRLLNHTPVSKMGINRDFYFSLESEQVWHNLGDSLAPKKDWADLLINSGLKGLSMQGNRPDNYKGYIVTKVEPAPEFKFGISIQINDHYEVESSQDKVEAAKELMNILSTNWEQSMQRSLKIALKVSTLGELK